MLLRDGCRLRCRISQLQPFGSFPSRPPPLPIPAIWFTSSNSLLCWRAPALIRDTVARKEAIRRARIAARQRKQYDETHFAIVGLASGALSRKAARTEGMASVPKAVRTRLLRNQYISQVGRYQFRLLHK